MIRRQQHWGTLRVSQEPEALLEILRTRTDPRLFPPSNRWAPRGVHLWSATVGSSDFEIRFAAHRMPFRLRGSISWEGQGTLVSLYVLRDLTNWLTSGALVVGGLGVLTYGWQSMETRVVGGWLLFMAFCIAAYSIRQTRRARAIVPALAQLWQATIDE
jgi:hypothetical protein